MTRNGRCTARSDCQQTAAQGQGECWSVFLTRGGSPWLKVSDSGNPMDLLGRYFTKLLKRLNLKRPGIGLYTLRHTFETVAGDSLDQVAVNTIMGHIDNSMAGVYRERISDERLRCVVEVVGA